MKMLWRILPVYKRLMKNKELSASGSADKLSKNFFILDLPIGKTTETNTTKGPTGICHQ